MNIWSVEAKCQCVNCFENLAFPVELAGQTIECPHCKQQTLLPEPWKDQTASLEQRKEAFKAYSAATRDQHGQEVQTLADRAFGKVDAKCPKCGSENTVKCEVAWAQGTSTSSFSGLGLDLAGDIGGFGGVKKSSTLMASYVAPPRKEAMNSSLLLLLIVMGFGLFVCLSWLSEEDSKPSWPWWLASLVCVGLMAYSWFALVKDGKRRHAAYLDKVRVYLKQWVCMRCGGIFSP